MNERSTTRRRQTPHLNVRPSMSPTATTLHGMVDAPPYRALRPSFAAVAVPVAFN